MQPTEKPRPLTHFTEEDRNEPEGIFWDPDPNAFPHLIPLNQQHGSPVTIVIPGINGTQAVWSGLASAVPGPVYHLDWDNQLDFPDPDIRDVSLSSFLRLGAWVLEYTDLNLKAWEAGRQLGFQLSGNRPVQFNLVGHSMGTVVIAGFLSTVGYCRIQSVHLVNGAVSGTAPVLDWTYHRNRLGVPVTNWYNPADPVLMPLKLAHQILNFTSGVALRSVPLATRFSTLSDLLNPCGLGAFPAFDENRDVESIQGESHDPQRVLEELAKGLG
ncbi:MAG: hypothetical protein HUU10_12835 [Bacteroidetes bacterium]|nr:hypothetical protein [Bacteroidota bacterium]